MQLGSYKNSEEFTNLVLNKRQDQILALLVNEGQVKLAELSKRFNVTEVTIRRDLEKMEQQGVLVRTFGGAILSQSKDVSINTREATMIKEKSRIGKAAAALIQPGEFIFIDSGTTTVHIVKHLDPGMPLTVITNAINIIVELQKRHIPAMMLGGMLWEGSSSLVGPDTEEMLKRLVFDRAFISATGFTVRDGFSNSNVFEIQLKGLAVAQAKEANVLIDQSKFGFRSLAPFAKTGDVQRIITDRLPDPEYIAHCKTEQVSIMIADE